MAASEDSGHESLHGLQPMGVLTGDYNLHKAVFMTVLVFEHLDTWKDRFLIGFHLFTSNNTTCYAEDLNLSHLKSVKGKVWGSCHGVL